MNGPQTPRPPAIPRSPALNITLLPPHLPVRLPHSLLLPLPQEYYHPPSFPTLFSLTSTLLQSNPNPSSSTTPLLPSPQRPVLHTPPAGADRLLFP
ncbi:hypothetical protein E2C01_099950 [Portunus trituberculatus]|uniref:Uncharacterized protein n=1 Tax=Portunus trituberculatus TaxID=210409 RepID=A0A5B7K551_PORTR|nr:hypothetical protein [Portunus trituberculatus]